MTITLALHLNDQVPWVMSFSTLISIAHLMDKRPYLVHPRVTNVRFGAGGRRGGRRSYLAKPFDVSTEVGLGEDVLEVPGEGLAF